MKNQLPTKVFAVSLVLAGLFNLAMQGVVAVGNDVAGVNLGFVTYALLIPSLTAIVALLYSAQPRLAVAGGILAAFGIPAGVLWTTLPLLVGTAEAQLALPLYLGGLALPVGGIVLAVGLWNSAQTPRWVGGLLAVAFIFFIIGWFVPNPIVVLAYPLLLLAAFAWLGLHFWGEMSSVGRSQPASA